MNRAGAETMVMNLYQAIDKTKFQFDFLYFSNNKADFDEEIESMGGEIYRIVERNPIRRMLVTIELLVQNPQWQTVHAHNLFANAFHVYAAYKAGVKQRIAHSHSIGSSSNKNLLRYIYQAFSRRMIAKYATNFVACSLAAGDYLFPLQRNIIVIPNSINTKIFIKAAEDHKNYLRTEFNITDDFLILLQLGRLHKAKNHKLSIKVARELKNKNIIFKLFFAGQGSLLVELQKQVKDLDLEKEIIFLGIRTDVPYLLASSDLMLMPSLYEGFGIVLIEAQATGIPSLISTTIPEDADMEMGLVYPYSLDKLPENWANKVIEICRRKISVSKEERLLKLKDRGFDNYSNVKNIEALYSEK
jgi:glycosyltransferase EpsF